MMQQYEAKTDSTELLHGEKVCLFEHHGPNGSISVSIWSYIHNMCSRKNNNVRTSTSERGFEVDFVGAKYDSYSAANALQAATNLYLYKKISGEHIHSLRVSAGEASCTVLYGLGKQEGIPPICWARKLSKETRTEWVCMPIIVAHQFNSALIKAMNWYTPRAHWDGEKHRMPGLARTR